MLFFKKKEQPQKRVRQYIGFSTECYDLLTQDERVLYMADLRKGGWEFSLRAVGWIIESRVGDSRLTYDTLDDVCAMGNVRIFTEREVDDLREWVAICEENAEDEFFQQESSFKEGFETFVNSIGLLRLPCLRAMKTMYWLAAQGHEIRVSDLRSNPELRSMGNLDMLFGDRLEEILGILNSLARQYR